jgi:pimeloyl-ACP methyl ester carboxylesterase
MHHRRQGSGPPLVLIHGLGGELCVWDPVLEDLEAEFDVIAVDLPGFGKSDPLDETPTPAALARAVGALLDELGIERAHVVGNSLGGWVALELAAQGRALTVTALCPAGLWGRPLGDGQVRDGRGQQLARQLRPLIPAALLVPRVRRLVMTPFVAHPERVPYGDAWRMVRSYARATAYAATNAAMRADHFRAAAEIDVPVTLAFGERDRLIRPARTAIRGAQTVMLADCGHIPMFDDPARVREVIVATARRGTPPGAHAAQTAAGRR